MFVLLIFGIFDKWADNINNVFLANRVKVFWAQCLAHSNVLQHLNLDDSLILTWINLRLCWSLVRLRNNNYWDWSLNRLFICWLNFLDYGRHFFLDLLRHCLHFHILLFNTIVILSDRIRLLHLSLLQFRFISLTSIGLQVFRLNLHTHVGVILIAILFASVWKYLGVIQHGLLFNIKLILHLRAWLTLTFWVLRNIFSNNHMATVDVFWVLAKFGIHFWLLWIF